jgi:hypothetical protein
LSGSLFFLTNVRFDITFVRTIVSIWLDHRNLTLKHQNTNLDTSRAFWYSLSPQRRWSYWWLHWRKLGWKQKSTTFHLQFCVPHGFQWNYLDVQETTHIHFFFYQAKYCAMFERAKESRRLKGLVKILVFLMMELF